LQTLIQPRLHLRIEHGSLLIGEMLGREGPCQGGFYPMPGSCLPRANRPPDPRPVLELLLGRTILFGALDYCAVEQIGWNSCGPIGGSTHEKLLGRRLLHNVAE
jgi:hypothetical protein